MLRKKKKVLKNNKTNIRTQSQHKLHRREEDSTTLEAVKAMEALNLETIILAEFREETFK